MSKKAIIAVAFGGLMFGGMTLATSPAFAQNRTVPEGDTIEFTPPIDLTPGQILSARPADRMMLEGRSAYVARPAAGLAPDQLDVGAELDR